jgi:hypothetical protein
MTGAANAAAGKNHFYRKNSKANANNNKVSNKAREGSV